MVTLTLDFHKCSAQLQIEPKKSAKTSVTGRVASVSPILPQHNSRHNQRNKAQIQAQQHPTQHKRHLPRLRKHTRSFLYVPSVLLYVPRILKIEPKKQDANDVQQYKHTTLQGCYFTVSL